MCGIAGIFLIDKKKYYLKIDLIKRMNEIQSHRGPDASGVWMSSDRNIAFGHSRLSIIDLSIKANQPFQDLTRDYTITFNGEIYNHSEIRKRLIQKGYKFKTKNSDTEVLLLSYIEWKKDCLKYIKGMFAFAIWDNNEQSLWLVRDRVGVKPLYYKIDRNKIFFASEIKAILLDETYNAKIAEESLFHYLSFLCSPSPNTMFEGIKKLDAGCWLSIDRKGKVVKKQYWDPIKNKESFRKNENDFNDLIYNQIKKSVKLRSISDVEVGIFLSGGIDSSTNASLFAELSKKRINTFSIGYDKEYDSYKSELNYAKLVSQKIGSNHHEKKLSKKDLIDIIEKMVYHQDEPISDPVCFPIYFVSKLARDNGVKVCQVGEGADELFFGYTNWARTSLINNVLKKPFFISPIKKILKKAMEILSIDYKYSYDLLSRSIKKLPIFWSGAEAFSESEKFRIFSKKMKNKFKNKSSWEIIKPHFDFFNKEMKYKNLENWMTYIDLKLRLPELLLMRIDKMSMACGLEARVPFLDHKLIEKLIDIPKEVKFKERKLKIILKECVKNLIPKIIIDRKKQGFGLPLKEWFSDSLGINEKEIILGFIRDTDYFDIHEIEKILSYRKGDTRIWFLLNLALWWKIFIKDKSYLKFR